MIPQALHILGRNTDLIVDPLVAKLFAEDFWSERKIRILSRRIAEERVILQAVDNATKIYSQCQLPVLSRLIDLLADQYAWHLSFIKRIMPDVRDEIQSTLREADLHALFIKGASLAPYPYGHVRQMNDVDLLFPCSDSLFRAAHAIQDLGFSHATSGEAAWVARVQPEHPSHEPISFHLSMSRHRDEREIRLDLHSWPISMAGVGELNTRIWSRIQPGNPMCPAPEDQLLMVFAHAVSGTLIRLRDSNDTYSIVHSSGPAFDWDYVVEMVDKNILHPVACGLLSKVHQEYSSKLVPSPVLKLIAKRSRTFSSLALMGMQPRSLDLVFMASRYLVHTLRIWWREAKTEKRWARVVLPWRYLLFSLRYYVLQTKAGNVSIVQRRCHRPVSAFPNLPLDSIVFLVPLSTVYESTKSIEYGSGLLSLPTLEGYTSTKLRETLPPSVHMTVNDSCTLLIRYGTAQILVTPIDAFVLTVDGVFSKTSYEALSCLATSLEAALEA